MTTTTHDVCAPGATPRAAADPALMRLRNALDQISGAVSPETAFVRLGGILQRPHEAGGPGWGCRARLLGIEGRGLTGIEAVATWCHFARVRCDLPALIPPGTPLATIT